MSPTRDLPSTLPSSRAGIHGRQVPGRLGSSSLQPTSYLIGWRGWRHSHHESAAIRPPKAARIARRVALPASRQRHPKSATSHLDPGLLSKHWHNTAPPLLCVPEQCLRQPSRSALLDPCLHSLLTHWRSRLVAGTRLTHSPLHLLGQRSGHAMTMPSHVNPTPRLGRLWHPSCSNAGKSLPTLC